MRRILTIRSVLALIASLVLVGGAVAGWQWKRARDARADTAAKWVQTLRDRAATEELLRLSAAVQRAEEAVLRIREQADEFSAGVERHQQTFRAPNRTLAEASQDLTRDSRRILASLSRQEDAARAELAAARAERDACLAQFRADMPPISKQQFAEWRLRANEENAAYIRLGEARLAKQSAAK